jgi:hypothetical protein
VHFVLFFSFRLLFRHFLLSSEDLVGALLLCHVIFKTISGILLGPVMHRKSCIAMVFFFLFFSVDLAV